MPEVSLLDRLVVSSVNFFRGDEGAQQVEMARFRFVQASEKPVDGFQCMPASDMQPGVVVPRLDTAIGFRDRFKRTDDGGPNCNNTTAPLAPRVNLRSKNILLRKQDGCDPGHHRDKKRARYAKRDRQNRFRAGAVQRAISR